MSKIEIESAEAAEPEKFDFSAPEDVLIEVVADDGAAAWQGASIESATIISGAEGVTGAASYEQGYGGFLEETIMSITDFPGVGWFVVTGVTGEYSKGDGWTTDDDMRFACTGIRPATADEIAMA